MERYLEVIGENIDRLVTLEIRAQGANRDVICHLYQAAHKKFGEPLTLLAARRLVDAVGLGDAVIITTGVTDPAFLPCGETDGPPGAAALASIVAYGLGGIPVLITEREATENLGGTCQAIGVGIRDFETARRVPFTGAVLSFPADDSAPEVARQYLDRLAPKALISLEKLGPNHLGVAHTATGKPASLTRARVEHLFDLAAERGILTIGIGDGGNEIGCGTIIEAVWQYKKWGRVCQCPCGGGLATRVATDVLVVGGTSNWGAYGIEACVAAILGKPDLIHSEDLERRALEECVRLGAVDSSVCKQILGVDGTPLSVQVSMVTLMRTMVANGLRPPWNRPF